METIAPTPTPNVFRTLNTIGKKLKSKKFTDKVLKELDAELKIISAYLGINQREAFLFPGYRSFLRCIDPIEHPLRLNP